MEISSLSYKQIHGDIMLYIVSFINACMWDYSTWNDFLLEVYPM